MPKERSIAKRLSGGEALTSLLHQVRQKLIAIPAFQKSPAVLDGMMKGIWERLARHEDFHSHRGYHGYSAKVSILGTDKVSSVNLTFTPSMSYGRPALNDSFTVPCDVKDFSVTVEIPVRPPNMVRAEAELPLPVQVEQEGQIVEKMVPAAKYKGKLKPGQTPPVTANMDVPAIKGELQMPDGAIDQYGIQTR